MIMVFKMHNIYSVDDLVQCSAISLQYGWCENFQFSHCNGICMLVCVCVWICVHVHIRISRIRTWTMNGSIEWTQENRNIENEKAKSKLWWHRTNFSFVRLMLIGCLSKMDEQQQWNEKLKLTKIVSRCQHNKPTTTNSNEACNYQKMLRRIQTFQKR